LCTWRGVIPFGKQLCRRRLGGPCGQQVEHDPAIHSCIKEGQQPHGLRYCQQVEGSDPSPLLSPGETHHEHWAQVWGPQYTRDREISQYTQTRANEALKRQEHVTYKERLRELNLFITEKRRLRGI